MARRGGKGGGGRRDFAQGGGPQGDQADAALAAIARAIGATIGSTSWEERIDVDGSGIHCSPTL